MPKEIKGNADELKKLMKQMDEADGKNDGIIHRKEATEFLNGLISKTVALRDKAPKEDVVTLNSNINVLQHLRDECERKKEITFSRRTDKEIEAFVEGNRPSVGVSSTPSESKSSPAMHGELNDRPHHGMLSQAKKVVSTVGAVK